MARSNKHKSTRRRCGLKYKKRQCGGSPASNRVHSFLNSDCASIATNSVAPSSNDVSAVNLYQTTGGSRSKKMSGGGSDWSSTVYSRGPVNNPSDPEVFAEFADPSVYVSNEELAKGSGADLSTVNVVPQTGGSKHNKSKKSKSKKSKSKKSKSKKSKSKKSKSKKSKSKKSKSKKQCGGSPASKQVHAFVNSGQIPEYNHVVSPRVRNYSCK